MDFTENYLFYQPYIVNNYIENYIQGVPDVELKHISMTPVEDRTPARLPDTSLTSYESISLGKYSIIYQYIWRISGVDYLLTILIIESHKKDKYSPVNSSGYFITEISIRLNTAVGKHIDSIVRHINYIMESLKLKEMREDAERLMQINTQLSYTDSSHLE